jgi:hypothetical protein
MNPAAAPAAPAAAVAIPSAIRVTRPTVSLTSWIRSPRDSTEARTVVLTVDTVALESATIACTCAATWRTSAAAAAASWAKGRSSTSSRVTSRWSSAAPRRIASSVSTASTQRPSTSRLVSPEAT